MNATTGTPLEGDAHLAQSIGDILSTPIGSRAMRRDYGSLLPFLVDAPQNALTRIQLFAATALALLKWEPRLRLTRVGIDYSAGGQVAITIEGERTDRAGPNSLARLSIPLRVPLGAPQSA